MTITPFLRLCLLCLLANSLFIDSALARLPRLSDKEKREFIESLAKPSKEKKVFYRWQSEAAGKNLIEANEMTPQLYNYFMNHNGISGAGLYIAEDITSSSRFGNTLIQVEVEPGYKFLDLSDPHINKQLWEKKIAHSDIYRLNPKVAVKNNSRDPWWVLKSREGIKFKPFSSQRVSLDTLANSYHNLLGKPQGNFFKTSIREDILRRAQTDSFVLESPFVEILEEEYGREYVQETIKSHIASRPPIKTLSEGTKILKNTGEYLSISDRKRITNMAIKISPKNIQESIDFLEYAKDVLSNADRKIITDMTKNIPAQSLQESIDFLEYAKDMLSKSDRKRIAAMAIKVSPKNMQESIDFLEYAKDVLSNADINKLVDNTPMLHYGSSSRSSFIDKGVLLMAQAGERLSKESGKKLVEKLIPLIWGHVDAGKLLSSTGAFLSPQHKKRIIDETLPYIKNSESSGYFLKTSTDYLSDKEIMRVINKAVPEFSPASAAADFLERGKSFLPKNHITTIVKNTLQYFNTKEEVVDFLERAGAYISKSDRNRIMKQALSFIDSEGELKAFQKVLPEVEYNKALKKFQISPKRMVNKMTERLRCLKRQLSFAGAM